MAATTKSNQATKSKASIATSDKRPGVPAERRPRTVSGPKRQRATDPEDFKTSVLNIRVKADLKTEASRTLEKMGISLPEAVRVFLGRVVREGAFPFPLEVPNPETAQALKESMASDPKRYASVDEMFDALEAGVR